MELNTTISDTYRLASEFAEITGESRFSAINVELRERLERERQKNKSDTKLREMRAIAKRCGGFLESGTSASDHGDELYDEHGLPK